MVGYLPIYAVGARERRAWNKLCQNKDGDSDAGFVSGIHMSKCNHLHTLFQPPSVKTSPATKHLLSSPSPSLPVIGPGYIVSHPSRPKPTHWTRMGSKKCAVGETPVLSGACPWDQVLMDHFRSFTVVPNLQQPTALYTFESTYRTESWHLIITISSLSEVACGEYC